MNPRNRLKVLTALCLGSLGLATFGQTSPATVPSPAKAAPSTQAMIHYGQLPLSFEPNRGQTSSNVQWLARGPEYTLFLTGNDAVLEMNKITPAKRGAVSPQEMTDLRPSISSSGMRMSLIGARTPEQSTGEDLQSGKANYFTGNDPAKWQHDVPMYGKVHMQGVYPGVDLKYYGHRGELEYDFVVAPGADASAIKLNFDGAKPALAANGDLVLPVEGGPEVRFNKPVVYQMKDGARQLVEGSFVIADNKAGGQVSFRLGAYDHSRELVIDPTLLFLGVFGTGNYETQAIGMAVDASGEIILTGETSDVNLPVSASAYQTTCNQDSAVAAANNYVRCGGFSEGYLGSAFITKISADGTSLVYSTYLHGFSGSELGQAVATDAAGDAIVLGQTGSSDFPVTSNAYQSLCMPYYGMRGVVGGDPSDFYPIAQHCDGNFAGGGTEWVSGGPTLFVAKLDPTGSTLLYSTFFGGTQQTYPNGLALDSAGNIYFTSYLQGGQTASNYYPQNGNVGFPVTSSAFQTQNAATQLTTLSVLSADGQTLLYSTLFGATNTPNPAWVQPLALAVGPNGIAYVGGYTYSDSVPTTAGAVRPACVDSTVYNATPELGFCEGYTAWLAAFDTTQSGQNSLKYATYIGGPEIPGGNSPQNQVWGLAADSENNVYVTGLTTSSSYPTTTGAYQTACQQVLGPVGQTYCGQSAFLTKINSTGTENVWSTLFEGNQGSNDYGQNIGFDTGGNVYLYGYDNNYTFDLPWVNPLEGRPGSTSGASYPFLATFSPDGSKLLFSTPLGNMNPNAANDFPVGMVLDSANNIYFAGYGADNGSMAATTGTYSTAVLGGSNRTYFGKISPLLAPTATSLNISPATATTGQTVTFTATVAGTTQSTPTPTGTVTLTNTSTNPATTLGTITLASGTGQFITSSLAAGSYSVTGSYSGDSTYDVSASSAMPLTITTPAQVLVPNVVGLTQTAATTSITGAGLVVGTVSTASSSTVPSGSVISEAPLAGTSVAVGASVNLVVSSGPAQVLVPNVVGLTQTAATTSITGAGLVVGTVSTASSSTVPSGSVISEAPLAGTSVAVGSSLNLVVSSGLAQVLVPNVVGLTQSAATTSITGAGLVVGTVLKASSSTVPSGSVISESPLAGASVTVGSSVNLVVSTGPAPTATFTITVIPPTETINRGVLGGFILELNSVKGFKGNVALSCSGGPAGSKCSDLPQTVKVNGTAFAVSGILFPKNSTPGTYTITFTGVSGSLTNTATAKFTVK